MHKENYELIPEDIREYCENHSSKQDYVLERIERDTNLFTHMPQMLAGSQQGLFLRFLSRMICPGNILEIGTFTGYSAVCLADGLADGGRLTTIEINPELEESIRRNIDVAGMTDRIELLIGDARNILHDRNELFDLIFIDADKENYSWYYEKAVGMLRQGGWLIVDNVLWYQRVIDKTAFNDPETKAIRQFNDLVMSDNRVDNLLLPFRDGLMLIQKK